MIKIAGSVRQIQAAIIKLFRDDATLSALTLNRIYPPGLVESASMPRINVSNVSTSETYAGIGVTAAYPTWKNFTIRITASDKNPKIVEKVYERMEDVIGSNRNYKPSTVWINDTVNGRDGTSTTASGYFRMLRVEGSTATEINPSKQYYTRTMVLGGRWLQTS